MPRRQDAAAAARASPSSSRKRRDFAGDHRKCSSIIIPDGRPDDEDSDGSDDDVTLAQAWCPCHSEFCSRGKQKRCSCYLCFVIGFLGFLIVFPLFLKWLVTSPVPSEWWHPDYPIFPALRDLFFIMDGVGKGYNVEVSNIPVSWHSCNHSCAGSTIGQDGAEMSFPISVSFNASGFEHTAYPAVFVSSDFSSWWLATDRRDASPTKFFPSYSTWSSQVYQCVTEQCSRPPKDLTDIREKGDITLDLQEGYGSMPIYMMACVSWKVESVEWQANATEMDSADIAEHCQAVGGVCGWPCGTNTQPSSNAMPGCPDGVISVDPTAGSVAGVTLTGSNFQGRVTVRACDNGPHAEECHTVETHMAEWPCHRCKVTSVIFEEGQSEESFDTIGKLNQTYQLTYDSLPRMEVLLENPQLEITDAAPRVYILTSTVNPEKTRPDGFSTGKWRKLYFEHHMILSDPFRYPMPSPVEVAEVPVAPLPGQETPAPTYFDPEVFYEQPMMLDASKKEMKFINKQKLTLDSPSCFASRGAIYVVACAMNISQYEELLDELQRGQEVAGPPFNDRCLAVTGKCGYACGGIQSVGAPALEHCSAEGTIPAAEIFEEDFELPTNEPSSPIVFMFVLSLTCGFSVKLMTYLPGLFTPVKHPQHYKPEHTKKFQYIATVTPSGGESKACVLRNLVGCMSALPSECKCPYHVVYADEGHRYPHKIMLRAFAKVLQEVPEGKTSFNQPQVPGQDEEWRPQWHSRKKDNLRLLTRIWTEQTRTLTLKGCETGKMVEEQQARERKRSEAEGDKKQDEKRLEKLRKECEEGRKALDSTLDTLSGIKALSHLQENFGWAKTDVLRLAEREKQEQAKKKVRQHDPEFIEAAEQVRRFEQALEKLKAELAVPEKRTAREGKLDLDLAMPQHLDDIEAYEGLVSTRNSARAEGGGGGAEGEPEQQPEVLYTLHYVARAKPKEDIRTLKVQHIARGMWYYKVPKELVESPDKLADNPEESKKVEEKWRWRRLRAKAQQYQDEDVADADNFIVPLRTSRGKAGGLNFVENYLYDCTHGFMYKNQLLKHSLFSIADARHQFQPDLFHETIPFFIKAETIHAESEEDVKLNARVAFTQSPQYFPEVKDKDDYLDTNNANHFRLNCMLRNCVGGVSSCGTNGTWLVRDRRAGKHGVASVFADASDEDQKIERQYFHETCKVEDTASSLDAVLRGQQSHYVNRKLAYGMAKDPQDYLAAVQRWAEGGVVLSLQTFLSFHRLRHEGGQMIWFTFFLFAFFMFGLMNLTLFWGYLGVLSWIDSLGVEEGGSNGVEPAMRDAAEGFAHFFIDILGIAEPYSEQVFVNMFLEVTTWLALVLSVMIILYVTTLISYYCHYRPCQRRGKRVKKTHWPVSMAQWVRLSITLDNLTYFLWFWTCFFWVFFNYSSVWWKMTYHYEGPGMVFFSFACQALGWAILIFSSLRYASEEGSSANEVFFLSLTNIWRTTQLFYITAPLVLYSIVKGFSDFLRHNMLDVDISFWEGGDRGVVAKSIAQWWTLALVVGALLSHIFYWSGWLPDAQLGGLIIVTFIAADVLHPCAFLWLGRAREPLPEPPKKGLPAWQRHLRRAFRLLTSAKLYRNLVRDVIFHPRTAGIIKWMGPVQTLVFPLITLLAPSFGVSQALLLLASART